MATIRHDFSRLRGMFLLVLQVGRSGLPSLYQDYVPAFSQ